jgi:hypothetical protein
MIVPTRYRRYRALSQALAALLLVTGWGAPLAIPHSWGDDPICVLVQRGDSSDTSRIGGVVVSAAQPEHCVVCHTARSFRSAPTSGGRLSVATTTGLVLDTPAGYVRRAPAFDRLPARAPPA